MTVAIVMIVILMWIAKIIVVNQGHVVGLATWLVVLVQETTSLMIGSGVMRTILTTGSV
jgi:hypothetical protein